MNERKSLFGECERWTIVGSDLDREINAALRPIMEKWAKQGYSIREISHIAQGAVMYVEHVAIIQNRKKL